MSETVLVAAFYKFAPLPRPADLRAPLKALGEAEGVKGTLLLAREGVNGTIAGPRAGVEAVLAALKAMPGFEDLPHKESEASEPPFLRFKVKLKEEIVTMGAPDVDPSANAGTYVEPEDWNALISAPDVVVIDTRNTYETEIGTFKGAVDPQTASFRDFPAWADGAAALKGKPRVAMFCTGGIRCEKATAYLKAQGFDDVYHLKGGILNYLEKVPEPDSLWRGECFVFDERVAVDHALAPGGYDQCRACRRPVSDEDKAHPHYLDGVSCPKCYPSLTEEKRRRFVERQRQIKLAKEKGRAHIGPGAFKPKVS